MMEQDIANYIAAYLEGSIFGIRFTQLTIWVVIGIIAGSLLPRPRPFGLIGSMIGGVLGGLLAGWAVTQFPELNVVRYIDDIPRGIRNEVSAGVSGFVGAIIVLTILRIVVPKSMRN